MKTINKPLRTVIEHVGQSYVDEPVYATVSEGNPLAVAVNAIYRSAPQVLPAIRDLSHYKHTRLNWISPKGPRT